MKTILGIALAASLAGCATAPRPLQGQFSSLAPAQVASQAATGELVRWGGHIVNVQPSRERSCFEIVGMPLSANGRPRSIDRSDGRFIACRSGFYDPDVFRAGRDVTISGHVEGFENRKVGDYDYHYPRVQADVVYLWPERRERDVIMERPMFYGRMGFGFGRRWGGW